MNHKKELLRGRGLELKRKNTSTPKTLERMAAGAIDRATA